MFNTNDALSERSSVRGSNWETAFDQNLSAFSNKLAEGIAKEVFLKLANTLKDPYIELPSKQSPLSTYFSFRIMKPEAALILKQMAQEAAELPPFKEWFERFCRSNQKLSKENDSIDISIASSPLPSSKIFVTPENEKGIDRYYFLDMMAVVGHQVETQLKTSFRQSLFLKENSNLKIEVTWYQKSNQFIETSRFHDHAIEIRAWIEGDQTKNAKSTKNLESMSSTASFASLAFETQKKDRQQAESRKLVLKIAFVFAAVVAIIFGMMMRPLQANKS